MDVRRTSDGGFVNLARSQVPCKRTICAANTRPLRALSHTCPPPPCRKKFGFDTPHVEFRLSPCRISTLPLSKTPELMAEQTSTSKTSELMAERASTSKTPELTAERDRKHFRHPFRQGGCRIRQGVVSKTMFSTPQGDKYAIISIVA